MFGVRRFAVLVFLVFGAVDWVGNLLKRKVEGMPVGIPFVLLNCAGLW